MNLMDLAIKIGVDDQASTAIDNLTHKVGEGLKTAAKVGIAAVGAIGAATVAYVKSAVDSYSEYEQLAGGAQKIFDEMDYARIEKDAYDAYKTLGISANDYLRIINDTGATFAATMGDESGYETAKKGLQAISDYASGTGKNVNELSQKFTLITRSTASYQSIADQFSGILPATSKDFLEQAQAAGLLSEEYTELTKVPVADYQYAVAGMLEYGTGKLGLAGNTANEAATTISGSIATMKGAWNNLKTGVAQNTGDMDLLIDNFVEATYNAGTNIIDRATITVEGIKSVFSNPEQRQKFIDLGKALLGKIGDGIKLLLGIEEGESPIGAAKKLISTLVIKMKEKAPEIIEAGKEALKTLLAGIMDTEESNVGFARVTGWLAGNLYEAISDAANYAWDWFTGAEFDADREKFGEDFIAGVMSGSETLRNSGAFSWGYNPNKEPLAEDPYPEFTKQFPTDAWSLRPQGTTVGDISITVNANTNATAREIGESTAEAFQQALDEREEANG